MISALDRAVALLEAGHELDVEEVDAILQHGPLAVRPRVELTATRLLGLVLRLAGTDDPAEVLTTLTTEAQRRGARAPAAPAPTCTPGPPAPPSDGGGIWLSPDEADIQHGQVWVVRTVGHGLGWAQIDGYDVKRGRKYWRAIGLTTRRAVQVKKVLEGAARASAAGGSGRADDRAPPAQQERRPRPPRPGPAAPVRLPVGPVHHRPR